MTIWELLLTAIALSMDAFAVAVSKGLATQRLNKKHMLIVGAWFGGFQALMPLIGWLIASKFSKYITRYDHWIAFALLAAIGINMIREALKKDDEETASASFGFRTMLIMALATSIDALAIGVSFAFLGVSSSRIIPYVCCIGAVTFLLSAAGVKIGSVFGAKYKAKAEIAGGIILIALGIKILIEHLTA